MKRSPIKRVNHKRKAKLYLIQFGPHSDWIRELGCLVCNERPVQPHHFPTRGAGGTAKDLTPLCQYHHAQFHEMGPGSFQETYEVDLVAEAARLWAEGRDE